MAAKTSLTVEFKSQTKEFFRSLSQVNVGIGGVVAGVGAMSAAAAAAGIAGAKALQKFAIKPAMELEGIKAGLEALLGSTEAAQERLDMLKKFSAATPFQLPGIVKADKLLQTFSAGALNTQDMLRMVGDAAASTAEKDFGNVALWVGRAYDSMQSGRPIGEAMSRLQELGLISGTARGEIEALNNAGEGVKAFDLLRKNLSKFSGTMEKMSATTSGRLSTLRDNFFLAGAEVGEQILPSLGSGIEKAIAKIQELSESGALRDLGMAIAPISQAAVDVATAFADIVLHELSLKAIASSFEMISAAAKATSAVFKAAMVKPSLAFNASKVLFGMLEQPSQLGPALLEQVPAMRDVMTSAPVMIFQNIAASLLSIDEKMPQAKPGLAY